MTKKIAIILLLISLSIFITPIAKADIDWGKEIIILFESLGSDLHDVKEKTRPYTAETWYRTSVVDVTSVGAGACVIPGSGYVTLPAEFLYLMKEVYNSAMGLGFLIYGEAHKDDFATILGLWTDEVTIDERTLDLVFKAAEEMALSHIKSNTGKDSPVDEYGITQGGKKVSTKVISQELAVKTGAKTSGKLGDKIAVKTGAKITGKYAAKGITAWVPVISAMVCGGLNAWIMDGILSASEEYYTKLNKFQKQRYMSDSSYEDHLLRILLRFLHDAKQ